MKRKGQALVEFALVVPLLLIILGGVVYCGLMVVEQERLAMASRHVARKMALNATERGLKSGKGGKALSSARDEAFRQTGEKSSNVRVKGINWGGLASETGNSPGRLSKIDTHTGMLMATQRVTLQDLGGRGGKPTTMGIGVVYHGVTLNRDLKDLAGLGQMARIGVPGVSATSVMPSELPPRGEKGVKGVLDMNAWIKDIVNEKYKK